MNGSLNVSNSERTSAKYASVHGVFDPALISPRWMTASTFGSELIRSISIGIESRLAGPYGMSPMTAKVNGFAAPVLSGLPTLSEGVAGTRAVSGVEQAETRRVAHNAK